MTETPAAADKRLRAAAVAAVLARLVGGTVHRVVGRHYPDEPAPRFCFGVRAGRDSLAGAHGAALLDTAAHAIELPEVAGLAAATPEAPPALGPGDSWLTVTADPGVVEVNTAPCPDLVTFADHLEDVWLAAGRAGLASTRWRYNGDEVDSGGGGQLPLGGPTAAGSPFFRHPALLPRMIRYFNDHPALSYWFLGECAGSASQAPRADEGVRERWEELRLACGWLEREAFRDRVTPEVLWSTLAPLLVDASGNSHRAELNVEKLWNPHLGERGQLGVVELRAFRMPPTPDGMTAAAALVRAVAARCALAPYDHPMIDWGGALHDRWALPRFLADDLDAVIADLDRHGLPLGPHLTALRRFRDARLARVTLGAATLDISRAIEFWPLVGDVASQERATSRLVDASSERLELVARAPGELAARVTIADHAITPRATRIDGAHGARTHVLGLRRRQYRPDPGLVPTLPADEPLEVTLAVGDQAVRVRWYAWRPDGGGYQGLPTSNDEATARRAERLVIEPVATDPGVTNPPAPTAAEPTAMTTWTLDVRGLERTPS